MLQEAIRDALPEWYERALLDAGVSPIGDPNIEMRLDPGGRGRAARASSSRSGCGPRRSSATTRASRSARTRKRSPTRSSTPRSSGSARASPAWSRSSARPPRATALLIDFEGFVDGTAFEGGAAEDYLLELGSGQLIEGFEEQLVGAKAGEEREVEVTFPDDYQAEHLAGEDAVFKVKVKEVREKVLPELDDDFASDASEFDTLEELRADIREKVGAALGSRAEEDFRVAAIDAAVDDGDGRGARRARRRRGRPNAGSGWNASSPAAAWTPTRSCRCRAKRARS